MADDADVVVGITADTAGLASGMSDASGIVDSAVQQMQADADSLSVSFQGMTDGITASVAGVSDSLGALDDSLAGTAAAAGEASEALNAYGETSAEAAARIQAMVAASLAEMDAAGGVALSERAAAEAAGLRVEATEAEIEALNAQVAAQTAQMVSMDGYITASEAATAATGEMGAALGALGAETAVINETGAALNNVGTISGGVAREFGVLTGEAMRGNFTRMEGSIVTLANRTGLLQQIFSTTGLSILGVVAAVGVVAVEFIEGAKQASALQAAIIGAGNSAGVTSGELGELRNSLGAATGNYADAQTAIIALVSSGKLVGPTLETGATAAVEASALTGQAISKTVAIVESLATDSAPAIAKLNQQWGFLTEAEYENIVALQQQGEATAAGEAAINAFADAMASRTAQMNQEVQGGYIAQYFHNIAIQAALASQALKDWGDTSPQVQLDTVLKDITATMDQLAYATQDQDKVAIAYFQNQLNAQEAQYASLQKTIAAQNQAAAATAAQANATKQVIAAEGNAQTVADELTKKYGEQEAALSKTAVAMVQYAEDEAFIAASANATIAQLDGLAVAITNIFAPAMAAAQAHDAQAAAMKAAAAAAKQESQDQQILNQVLQQAQEQVQSVVQLEQQLADGMSGPWAQAQDKYNKEIAELNTAYNALGVQLNLAVISQQQYNTAVAGLVQASEEAGQQLDETNAKLEAQANVIGKVTQQLQDEINASAAIDVIQKAELETDKEVNAAMATTHDLLGQNYTDRVQQVNAINSQREALLNVNAALLTQQQDVKNNQAIDQEWVSEFSSGLDSLGTSLAGFMTGALKSWKDFGNALISDTEQFIAAIIEQFLKLEVFNVIINSLFGIGGTASALPTGLGNGLISQLLGGTIGGAEESGSGIASDIGTGLSGEIAGEYGSSSSGVLSSLDVGNQIASNANGFMGWLFGDSSAESAATDLGGYGFGGGSSLGLVPDYANASDIGELGDAAPTEGIFQEFAPYLSIIGAGLAGINEFQAAGGGVGGVVGGADYAYGTLAAGTAVTAGVSTLAAGGGFAAAGMAAFDAIPVIGLVALAAEVLNMVTGGGLFGTAASPTGTQENVTVGPSGASMTAAEDLKGKKGLFQGSYWETEPLAVPAADQTAINSFFTGLQNAVQTGATELGVQMPAIIGGSFQETFDTTGKMLTQVSTVLGQTYSESMQDFEERITADNLLQLLPASQNATAIAAAWQSSADTLLDGTEMLLQAQTDINHGEGLLGSSDTSLADIASTVAALAQSGETMVQTYERLQSEVQTVNDDFLTLGLTTGQTGIALVNLADQMTTAAGGASNLASLVQQFAAAYSTVQQQQSGNLASLQNTSNMDLTALGETPGESMAQFYADFQAALPTLTGAEVDQWMQAGIALAAVNTALTNIAANQQKYADYEVQSQGDAFVQSMVKVIETENSSIASANQLAQAAGLAGASQKDLAVIIQTGATQMAQALATLAQGIQTDVANLYGANAAEAGTASMGALDYAAIQSQQAQSAAAAQATADSNALDLIQKLGDYAYASGDTMQDVLKTFGVTEQQLATTLGETPAQVDAQLAQAEQQSAALVTMASEGQTQTGLLGDILAAIQGKPMPFNISSLGASGATPWSLPGSPGSVSSEPIATTSPDVVTAVKQQTASSTDIVMAITANTAMLSKLYGALRPTNQRNTRPTGPGSYAPV